MRETRVVVTMKGGEVERVFLVEGTDEEFAELQRSLKENHEVDFAVRVATGPTMSAGRAAAVIPAVVLEDQVEQDIEERGDPEEMGEAFRADMGPEDCRGGDAEEVAIADALGGAR